MSRNIGSLNCWESSGPVQACIGVDLMLAYSGDGNYSIVFCIVSAATLRTHSQLDHMTQKDEWLDYVRSILQHPVHCGHWDKWPSALLLHWYIQKISWCFWWNITESQTTPISNSMLNCPPRTSTTDTGTVPNMQTHIMKPQKLLICPHPCCEGI